MLRFIHANRLTSLLHARDWAGFARRYNGPAYAKNRYDVRLAAAHARHRDGRPSSVPATSKRGRRGTLLRRGDRGDAVRDMQRMLTRLIEADVDLVVALAPRLGIELPWQ